MIGEVSKRKIYMGSDHAGFKAKEDLKGYVEAKGYAVTDLGCFSEDPCDYPDIAREVGEKVLEEQGAQGIVICGSGIGIAIAANRFKGIRAAMVTNPHLAEMSRRHNDANILALGARENTMDELKAIIDSFLSTEFEADEERHVRRVKKIDTIG